MTIQGLENLNALLFADGQLASYRINVDTQTKLLSQTRQLRARVTRVGFEQTVGLCPEHHVLEHTERVHEHEVLVHHPDSGIDSVTRAENACGLAAYEYLSLISLIEAVEDAHQGGLASPIFTDDAVYAAAPHRQIDIAVGNDRSKSLGDATQFKRVLTGLISSVDPGFFCGCFNCVCSHARRLLSNSGPMTAGSTCRQPNLPWTDLGLTCTGAKPAPDRGPGPVLPISTCRRYRWCSRAQQGLQQRSLPRHRPPRLSCRR